MHFVTLIIARLHAFGHKFHLQGRLSSDFLFGVIAFFDIDLELYNQRQGQRVFSGKLFKGMLSEVL